MKISAFARGPQEYAAGHAKTPYTSGPELPFQSSCLATLHVMAYAGRRGKCRRSTERLLRLICHLDMMQGM